jgi:hypothetical protein
MSLGYQDTPIIPGQKYHVHDGERPQPAVVTPGNLCDLPPVTPPSDAIYLFDGSSATAEQWEHCKDSAPLKWKVENGYMEVVKGTGQIRTKQEFGDIQLHVEWAAPFHIEINAKGEKVTSQGRGNSGVFLMGLYEVQVLDNWLNPTYPDGTLGGLYGQWPPLVNAAARRGSWNIYDIIWKAPVFDGDTLVSPAYITVLINGILVHHHKELMGPTQHKATAEYKPHAAKGPIELQDHGNPVRFRNIWVRELTDYDAGCGCGCCCDTK